MEIVLTPRVKETQEAFYGRHQNVTPGPATDLLREEEQTFIESRNSFYMATVNEDGWPYIQHRGGSTGFLKAISPSQVAFADYKGNRQLVSTGNLSSNNRVSLFLIDYPNRTRLKILGETKVYPKSDIPEEILAKMSDLELRRTERFFLIDVVSYDWNCPQYITPRYSEEEIAPVIEALKQRIHDLENS